MKFIYSFLFIAAFVSTSMAQLGFDIAAKGQVNSTWLFNQNISDQGKEQIMRQVGGVITDLDLVYEWGFLASD